MTGTSQVLPGSTTPGQRTMTGTRMPPSYGQPLPARSGALCVGPSSPPLSDVKMTNVLSATPASSSAATIFPVESSTLCTIAAYVGFFWFVGGLALYLSIRSFLPWMGVCTA